MKHLELLPLRLLRSLPLQKLQGLQGLVSSVELKLILKNFLKLPQTFKLKTIKDHTVNDAYFLAIIHKTSSIVLNKSKINASHQAILKVLKNAPVLEKIMPAVSQPQALPHLSAMNNYTSIITNNN